MRIRPHRRAVALTVVAVLVLSVPGGAAPVRAGGPSSALERYRAVFLADREPATFTRPIGPIPCRNGSAGPFPCKKVDLLSFTPLSELGGTTANDIWGWRDPATGKEYAIQGLANGTAFVDISDPDDPVVVGQLPTPTIPSIWRDVEVYKNHAFIVSDLAFDHGLSIFDLRELRDPPITPMIFGESAFYTEFGSAHTVSINRKTGYAYVSGSDTCNEGLHMVDISKPRDPRFVGCFGKDGYSHDTQCVVYWGPDRRHRGKEVCFASNEDTLTIVDVTKKKRPKMLSRTSYPGVGYTHQGWLFRGQKLFALNDELDEQEKGHNTRTRYFDVSNLDKPKLVAVYDGPTPAIDHNLYVKDGLVYEANYRAGLRIIRPFKRQVGFFDIYPSDNLPEFNGAWSPYPFLPSGVVLVSGIEQGLFVLRPKVAGS
ncbi:MAG TPA: choice-of-anchor B family protein [Actinomycetota bacterium]|nr:choice-of-anchor B family protein [Actinomycetota bacterium]